MSDYFKVLEKKIIEQASLIGECPHTWAEIFWALDLDCRATSTSVVFHCPECHTDNISFCPQLTNRPYPQFRCRNHNIFKKGSGMFNNHVYLVKYMLKTQLNKDLKVWEVYKLINQHLPKEIEF